MRPIDELVLAAERLCKTLDSSIDNEFKFTDEINLYLEKMNWEAYRMKEDLKRIKEYCEV